MDLSTTFSGLAGTTGLSSSTDSVRVVILAPTVIEISAVTGTGIAGESITIVGTLLDEHGQAGGVRRTNPGWSDSPLTAFQWAPSTPSSRIKLAGSGG